MLLIAFMEYVCTIGYLCYLIPFSILVDLKGGESKMSLYASSFLSKCEF